MFKQLPIAHLHPSALKAAEAAECARQQSQFWEFYDRMFADQKALKVPDLVTTAQGLNLEVTSFEACLSAGTMAERIDADISEAKKLGLNGTPASLIGEIDSRDRVRVMKRVSGAQAYDVFAAALQGVLDGPSGR